MILYYVRNVSRFFTCLLFIFSLHLKAVDTPQTVPGTEQNLARPGSSTSWSTGLGNAASSDDKYVGITADGLVNNNEYTDYIYASNFNLSIPDGKVITGISVNIERTDVNNAKDDVVSIVKNGVIGSTNKALNSAWSSEATKTYGGTTDTWGEDWTSTDLNSANFGVVFSVKKAGNGGGNPTPKIDKISISVNYGSVLPVELISFDAVSQEHSVTLNWITASETNNDFFTIERSTNMQNWNSLQTISGSLNSNNTLHYDWEDYFPVQGMSYYRIMQTDIDGKTSYSPIKESNRQSETTALVLFNSIQILHSADRMNKYDLLLFSSNGALVQSDNNIQDSQIISFPNLKPGVYLFHFRQREQIIVSDKILIK